MSQLIVRKVSEDTVRALKLRAARHGRSAESEHREILRAALASEESAGTFKAFLASMPNVGTDEDFAIARDMPREGL
jgi:plasmid stability protein